MWTQILNVFWCSKNFKVISVKILYVKSPILTKMTLCIAGIRSPHNSCPGTSSLTLLLWLQGIHDASCYPESKLKSFEHEFSPDSCHTAAHIRQGCCIDTEPIVVTILAMECYRMMGKSTKAQNTRQSTNCGLIFLYVLRSNISWPPFQ